MRPAMKLAGNLFVPFVPESPDEFANGASTGHVALTTDGTGFSVTASCAAKLPKPKVHTAAKHQPRIRYLTENVETHLAASYRVT